MNLFGKAKKAPSPKESIIRLRETLDMLEKRERFLQVKIDNEVAVAKANVHKNKRAALMALKRKKAYSAQVEKIMGARMTLETQVMAIENANVNLEAMNAMKAGADAMKTIHGKMDINQVDATMDDINEQMSLANEISDAIAQPVGMGGLDLDEDELAAELDSLEQEELESRLLGAQPVPATSLGTGASKEAVAAAASSSGVRLPAVPVAEPKIAQPPRPSRVQVDDDEDAELAELRASMAM